ncbi:FIG00652754: hypothetical protein [hydrothermal vent metagenome]|uniref:Bacterial surface antigen (D15) domain-containing protein n=1 Tax=hydrothermal vent metagenome TaxID=652676 RepID=A0A3B0TF37_9ZZZZ
MRIPLRIGKSSAKISLLFLVVAISSCNSLKRVEENELLITKNSIHTDGEKVVDENIENLIVQKRNSTVLGYPLRLNLYNLAKVDPDSSFQDWLYRKEKRKPRLERFLSKKQVGRLGESFVVKGMSEWLKNIGEAPATLDTLRTQKTLKRLSAYYRTKGFFNNTTSYKIDSLEKKQRVVVNYEISLGGPYVLDSVYQDISSKALDSIYNVVKKESFVKSGQQFDLENFNNERERLTSIFRNNGVWNFQESAISYNVISDTTALGNDRKMNIKLKIDNLKKRDENSISTSEYKVFRFDKINIYTDYLYGKSDEQLKFERFGDYTVFYRDKLRFKPETLTDAVFFSKDSVYRDLDRVKTYRQITSLNVFKYPAIAFVEDSTNTNLTVNIYLAERPKYSFSTNLDATHSNIQRVGLAFSPSLQARNIFKGAENLSLSGRLNIGNSSDPSIADSRFFNILEFGGDLSLDFPRIWMPFVNTKKFIPNYMLPRTRATLGASFQQNIGLDKETFNAVLGYNWTPSNFVKNEVEPLNVQFVRNLNKNRFFNVYRNTYNRLDAIARADNFMNEPLLAGSYDANGNLTIPMGTASFTKAILDRQVSSTPEEFLNVSRIEERRIRLTENNLIFASNYTFNKNNRNGITDNNFYRFRFKLESAGNLLSALSYVIPFNENQDENLLIFEVPYSQYLKTEFDYVKYWDLSDANVLAFRSFFGIAIPYGNSNNIPFVRSYFGGGSNDNRAWQPYSLGPGRTDAINDFNEANLKIALNLEYRFPIVGNFKGAFFADAGNIWNVFDNVDDPAATFNGLSSLKDIALGSGFGIRYDFTYFVLRGDLGFKTYNPAEETSKRWFRDYNFGHSVLQIGINYPF